MRIDWVPASAAMLVTGAMALALASLVSVGGGEGSEGSDALRLVEANDGRWLAAAAIFFLAALALILGLPALLSLFSGSGRFTAVAAGVTLAVGNLGLAGFAMLLVFFRAMVRSDAVRGRTFDSVLEDPGLQVFLLGWVAAFLLGELLLLVALLQAGPAAAPRWTPALLGAHLVSQAVGSLLPDFLARASVLLLSAALCGLAIRAARPAPPRRPR